MFASTRFRISFFCVFVTSICDVCQFYDRFRIVRGEFRGQFHASVLSRNKCAFISFEAQAFIGNNPGIRMQSKMKISSTVPSERAHKFMDGLHQHKCIIDTAVDVPFVIVLSFSRQTSKAIERSKQIPLRLDTADTYTFIV